MFDIELALLNKITSQEDILKVWESGLRSEVFEDPQNKSVFSFAIKYWLDNEMKTPPTLDVLRYEFPGWIPSDSETESTSWLISTLKERHITNSAQEMMRTAASIVNGEPRDALKLLMEESWRVHQETLPRSNRSDTSTNIEERRLRYFEAIDNANLTGAPLGFPEVDEHTRGILPGELAAVAGYAKCVSASTEIVTEKRGRIKIGDLLPEAEVGAYTEFRGDYVLTRNGRQEIQAVYHKGREAGLEINTNLGSVTSTKEHRFLVAEESGLEWKYAGDLKIGDKLLKSFESNVESRSDALAGLCGWVIAEGSMGYGSISITKLEETRDRVRDNLYGLPARDDIRSRLESLRYDYVEDESGFHLDVRSSKELRESTGLGFWTSGEKKVPEYVLSDKSLYAEFLKCYLEGDGDLSNGFSITSKSRELVEQVHTMLGVLGVVSRPPREVRVKLAGWTEPRTYWNVQIFKGSNIRRYEEKVGFITEWSRRRGLGVPVREPRMSYKTRIPWTNRWIYRVGELLSEIPFEKRRYETNLSNRRRSNRSTISRNRHFLSASRNQSYADLDSQAISEVVEDLSFYEEYLTGVPEWESLKEVARLQYAPAEVLSISEVEDDFWDLTVDETHSYLANGFMSHNTGKSVSLINSAIAARREGYTPCVFTLEQSVYEFEERLDAFASGVGYGKMQRRELDMEDQKKLRESQEELASYGSLFIEQPERGERSVRHLVNRARQLGADFLIIDQLSFMEPSRRTSSVFEQHSQIIHELKEEITSDSSGKLPTLLAVQFNRGAVSTKGERGGLHQIANSSSIEQTVDIAYGLYRSKELRANNCMVLDILGARRSEPMSWLLHWELDRHSKFFVRQEYED